MEEEKRRNVWLDIFRYFLAFLVVSIHASAEILGFDFSAICRLAVPMFFVISGYFAYASDSSSELDRAKRAVKRNFYYMLITVSIIVATNVIGSIIQGGLSTYIYKVLNPEIFFNVLILNTFPGLVQGWFVIALFLISVVQYFLVKYNLTKALYFIVPIGLILLFTPYVYQICRGGVSSTIDIIAIG